MTDIEVVDINDNTNKEDIKENVKEEITPPEGGVIRRVLEHPSSIKENVKEEIKENVKEEIKENVKEEVLEKTEKRRFAKI